MSLGDALKAVGKDLLKEVDHQIAAGSTELSAALLKGSDGFVMYPADRPQEQEKEGQKEQPQQDMEMER